MAPASSPADAGLRSIVAVAFLAGFACMTVELTAVRLLAPSFGDSAYVWTNVIGVILLAWALGAWAGGRWCERPGGSPLRRLLLGAAAGTALAPLLGPSLGAWLLPQELPLDAAMPALVRGSLAASCVLFAPAIWLLGALSPGLVAAAARRAPIGRAAGTVHAASTAGSLVGTFAATHALVPVLGCRLSLWVAALALLGAALVLLRDRRGALALVLVGLSAALHRGPLRAVPEGRQLLAERETAIQYLQVVRSDADGRARTELKINEGLDSYHSVAVEGSVLTGGGYYDYHALVPFLAGDGTRPRGLRALSIGDAAGTFRRIYDAVHPGAQVDAVEIDAAAVELGEHWFAGRRAPGAVAVVDGRVFVDRAHARWHVIHVDAYAHQVYIPAHLASREFFRAVQQRLEPGGVVACNVGGLDADDPVVQAMGSTLAQEFADVAALHIPGSRNLLLVARRDRPFDWSGLGRVELGDERLGEPDRAAFARVLAQAAAVGAFVPIRGNAPPLVDDCPRLDRLLLQSYVAREDAPVPTATGGATPLAAAEVDAHEARVAGDAHRVLAAVRGSQQESAYLRLLAGDARWQRRELAGAAAEYRAGIGLAGAADPEMRGQLHERLDAVEGELRPVRAALAAAQQSAWLAGVAIAVLLAISYRMSRMPAAPSVSVSTAAR